MLKTQHIFYCILFWRQRLKDSAGTDISISILWFFLLDLSKTYKLALVLPSIGFLEPLYIFEPKRLLDRSSLFEIFCMLFLLFQLMQQSCQDMLLNHEWSFRLLTNKPHWLRWIRLRTCCITFQDVSWRCWIWSCFCKVCWGLCSRISSCCWTSSLHNLTNYFVYFIYFETYKNW